MFYGNENISFLINHQNAEQILTFHIAVIRLHVKITGNRSMKGREILKAILAFLKYAVFFYARYHYTREENTMRSISFIAKTIRRFALDKLYTSGGRHRIDKMNARFPLLSIFLFVMTSLCSASSLL